MKPLVSCLYPFHSNQSHVKGFMFHEKKKKEANKNTEAQRKCHRLTYTIVQQAESDILPRSIYVYI